MSERFGLNWQDEPANRIAYFMEIMRLESEKAGKESRETDKKNRFRKRG